MDDWKAAVWVIVIMVSLVMFGCGLVAGIAIAQRNCVEPPKVYKQSTNERRSYSL